MIIFGMRSFVRLIATLNVVCGSCRNPAAQRVIKRTRWFTLFFIPVFPVGVTRVMTCTYCGRASKLTKEQVDQMVAAAAGDPNQPAMMTPAGDQSTSSATAREHPHS